jgi:hypothetical protein
MNGGAVMIAILSRWVGAYQGIKIVTFKFMRVVEKDFQITNAIRARVVI